MKRLMRFILYCCCVPWFWSHAQSTTPEVISNSGNHFVSPNAQVSWTLGESVIETQTGASNTLTQGFHQTQLTVIAVDDPELAYEVRVFPNPVSESLNASWDSPEAVLDFKLVDLLGHVLLERTGMEGGEARFDLSQLSQGEYLLLVRHVQSNSGKNFKVQVIR